MQGGRDSPASSHAPGNMSFSNNDQVPFSPCTWWPPLLVLASDRAVSFQAAGSCRRAYRKTLARGPSVFPQDPVFFANAIGGRRLPQPERAAQGGGWQGRREGGAEVGRRERGGGRQSSAAPSLVSAGWRWLRVPLRWCSPSQALRPPSLPLPSAEASRSPARRWACAR